MGKKKDEKNICEINAGLAKISVDISSVKARLLELEKENRQLRSSLLTSKSDYKRLETISYRERKLESQTTLRRIGQRFITVSDDLEQARKMLKDSKIDPSHIAPIEYILSSLEKAFIDIGLVPYEPIGDKFNPHSCELGGREQSSEYDEDIICRIIRKGYKIGEEIIRPAIVVCSQKNDSEINGSDRETNKEEK